MDQAHRRAEMVKRQIARRGIDDPHLLAAFRAVPRERFDRVVANLPFVVTPRRPDVPTYTYRDAGLAGDDVVRRMLLGSPEHLAEGGLAQFLGNWLARKALRR